MSTEGNEDPTEEVDPTEVIPQPEPTTKDAEIDPDRVDQSEVARFMAKRALMFGIPMVLVGVLLVALGLPSWIIIIALGLALVAVVFELEL